MEQSHHCRYPLVFEPLNTLAQRSYRKKEKTFLYAFILIITFMLVKVAGGLFTNSLALLADAGHMFIDSSSLFIALLAFSLSRKERDTKRTFGYQRLQVIAALINGLMLLAIGSTIIHAAIERFSSPEEVKGDAMLAIALAGLFVNFIVLSLIHQSSHGDTHKNLNVMGAMFHVIADILGSVAAIIAAVIIVLTGWHFADPILSIFIAIMILLSAFFLLKEVLHVLLQGTPHTINIEKLHNELETLHPDIDNIHHIHAWMITAEEPVISLHVHIKQASSINTVLKIIKSYLQTHYAVHESTIQIETENTCPDMPSNCPNKPLKLNITENQ